MVANGKLVVNWTYEALDELKKIGEKAGVSTLYLNANRIAMELIGSPTVSTIMLGALAQASGLVSMEALEKSVMERFHGSMGETNAKMVRMGFKEVKQV
jgi:2-oxoisovalerate ferredoxin oxidoreductase gamma subunit